MGSGSILIVDDDESICKSLALIFNKKGYMTETASTGQEALDKAAEQLFNVALLDMRLPDMEGTALLKPLKKSQPDIILLIITGYASLKTAMSALNNGASGYLTKPVDVDELLAKIKDNIEMQNLRVENVQLDAALQKEWGERKRAEEKVTRRNKELTLLNQIIAVSAAHPDPKIILETACQELAVAFDTPQTVAILLNEKEDLATIVAEHRHEDSPSSLNLNIPIKGNDPLIQHLFNRKGPLVIDDVSKDAHLISTKYLLNQYEATSLLILPLLIKQDVVGCLALGTEQPYHFSIEEVGLAWSVSEQVSVALARARLVQSHERLFTAIEQTADSVVITDTEGAILYVNPAFEKASGYDQVEVIGQNPRFLKSGKQPAEVYKDLWQTISTGNVWQGQFVNKNKDGVHYIEDVTISPVRDDKNNIVNYVAVKRNITRELELEEQYRQSQKMETIGQLTGGIAHDFNNLLTAVIGFAELTQMRLDADDPIQKMVDKILHSGRRATDLVGQLMAFSRKQVIEPTIINLNDIVEDIQKMLHRIIGETTEMDTILTDELWPIEADRTQIEQVIVNLAVNARDAMPHGGQLTVETSNVILTNEYAADHLGVEPGEHVLLSVGDTGLGMSKEVLEHIFEPFYTTKEQGKGSGLGLSTVFGIVQQSNGHIWVDSEEGKGTTFKLYFPKCQEATATEFQDEYVDDIPQGTENILLVEDEPAVRELAAYMLRQQGYMVQEASNGREALELIKTQDTQIHLLVTDVVMPHMNGKELADQIQALRPHIKILFTSGYTDDAIVQHGVLKPGIAFLPKPFSPMALCKKVRETLDVSPSEIVE